MYGKDKQPVYMQMIDTVDGESKHYYLLFVLIPVVTRPFDTCSVWRWSLRYTVQNFETRVTITPEVSKAV